MVTPEVLVTAGVGIAGLLVTGGGFLYRRDDNHKDDLEDEIADNAEDIEELDTAFGQMAQRLFGHPKDDTDSGALLTRAERVAEAEEDIDSLSDEVRDAKEAAEENGEDIETLAQRQEEHARQTRRALERIEEQLDASLIREDDFLRGGGGDPPSGGD